MSLGVGNAIAKVVPTTQAPTSTDFNHLDNIQVLSIPSEISAVSHCATSGALAHRHKAAGVLNWVLFHALPQGISMLFNIVLVLLFLMLLGVIPAWPHSRNWGYYPSGGLGLMLLILIFLMLAGRI
jgi:hypothetical protein